MKIYIKLCLFRNHGLSTRDTVDILSYNRLDTFQAVVGNWLLPQAKDIANKRSDTNYLDSKLSLINQIKFHQDQIIIKLFIIFTLYLLKIAMD